MAEAGTCFKLTKLLLGSFLSKPPNAPTSLTLTPTARSIEVSWRPGAATSTYNTDVYVLEVAPRSAQLLATLGAEFSRFLQFYSGAECGYSITKLQPEQDWAIRVRCVNSKGVSAWVEADVATCQVPVNCGGTGPMGNSNDNDDGGGGGGGGGGVVYTWDQTPTHVELCIPAPPALTGKRVKVRVKPKHIEVLFDGKAVFAGKLPKEVRCQEDGDFEWELRDAASKGAAAAAGAAAGVGSGAAGAGAGAAGEAAPGGGGGGGGGGAVVAVAKDRELFITLEKRIFDCVQYDPQAQWWGPCTSQIQLTHSLKPPGFNPSAYQVRNRFQSLCFQTSACTAYAVGLRAGRGGAVQVESS
jgi:hypothetical protein